MLQFLCLSYVVAFCRYAYGFERPSAVQQRAILPILKGRDVHRPIMNRYLSSDGYWSLLGHDVGWAVINRFSLLQHVSFIHEQLTDAPD